MAEVWVKTADNRTKVRGRDITTVGIAAGGRDALVEVTALGDKHIIARKADAVPAGPGFDSDKVLDIATEMADDFMQILHNIAGAGSAYYEIGFTGEEFEILS